MKIREEKDSLGRVEIPIDAYYGAQTERARQNFTDSGLGLPRGFIRSLAIIKRFAAAANGDLQLLDPKMAEIIMAAAQEVIDGGFDDAFVVDLFQTGSGTSTNMNMNEGITADQEKCNSYVDKSLALVTYLVPQLGYDKSAAISKKAHATGKRIADVVLEEGVLTQEELDKLIR